MKRQITIKSANIVNNQLILITNESITGLTPGEHMIVDSDHFSFIYLMEDHDDYTYLALPESIWPVLKNSLNENQPALLVSDNEKIELLSFQEEMNYLISNIKGNGNYGDEMVRKVECTF